MKIRAVSLDKARKHNYKNMAIAARCKDNKKNRAALHNGARIKTFAYNELGRPGANIGIISQSRYIPKPLWNYAAIVKSVPRSHRLIRSQ